MTLDANARETLDKWHRMVAAGDLSQVASLCAPEAVFRSPVAHTPYRGAGLVAAFLQQAVQTFSGFRYHRTFGCEWLHVDFDRELGPFYLGACRFKSTTAGLMAVSTTAGALP